MRKQAVAVKSMKNVAMKHALQLNLEQKNVSLTPCDTERKLLAPSIVNHGVQNVIMLVYIRMIVVYSI